MYDHAQSPRLGQRVAVENPGILVTDDYPEAPYLGQVIVKDSFLQVWIGAEWLAVQLFSPPAP